MAIQDSTTIENWTIHDLENLPGEENDSYEYKSSGIANNKDKFADTITKAASAFWNTGGGFFYVGVDNKGRIDGGIEPTIGNQPITEWADQILFRVSPIGPYRTKFITLEDSSTKGVFVIAFGESANLPHQAPDNKYYVRAGAHSHPAAHYIVEALRARRATTQPLLLARVVPHAFKAQVLDLSIVCLSNHPALDIEINISPIPHIYDNLPGSFPQVIPFIDILHPFSIEIGSLLDIRKTIGDEPLKLVLKYSNTLKQHFKSSQIIEVNEHISKARLTGDGIYSISEKFLKQIVDQLGFINQNLSSLPKDKSDE